MLIVTVLASIASTPSSLSTQILLAAAFIESHSLIRFQIILLDVVPDNGQIFNGELLINSWF